ncbi:hypothetical protein L2E82_20255 [Cichorium intybus]|uniref:Uncharacterized protein n=1 Tax=Cichorium intybus TaxID=13427 RepID=A0ACB9DSU3_CICIN|nr:hypothetical protein L2E82_20255 [Cichorium intybus]
MRSTTMALGLGPDSVHGKKITTEREKINNENGSVTTPLGIPCGAQKASSLGSNRKCVTVFDTGGLMETIKLKERMDQITTTQGLQGVSMECATVLNNRLDAYLKGLIRSFTHFRTVNGVRPGGEPGICSGEATSKGRN